MISYREHSDREIRCFKRFEVAAILTYSCKAPQLETLAYSSGGYIIGTHFKLFIRFPSNDVWSRMVALNYAGWFDNAVPRILRI